jgi:hypothetical protein
MGRLEGIKVGFRLNFPIKIKKKGEKKTSVREGETGETICLTL